ncbi:MAG TPA: NAD(P)H-dependent oxidoreductase [Pyrinomonadaceae bacterium]|nr:NAD(P)H-dependent oxidoreductase [Pyrinomonadaceae bacterium]
MADKLRILGISGSLRKASFNTAALRAAVELCPDEAEIEICEIGNLPLFDQDFEHDLPAAVKEFKDKVAAADAILFATPEYNYSVPGVLKNAIDCGSRPYGHSAWDGKPAAIMGASGGAIATARAQYDLRKMMVFLNMFPINKPEVMIGNAGSRFDAEGNLTDEPTEQFIRQMLENLIAWAKKLK